MHNDSNPSHPGPLSDLVVIDLTRALAGPHAAMMLGDLGARVIKVEAPGSGDETRGWGPPFVDGVSTYFLSCNRNKESVALDLKSDDGRQVLRELIARADVVCENFRTGVMDRLGLGTTELLELNPRLVILSITGFGHDGPEGGRAGYDQILQGEAGLMSLTGPGPDEPTRVGVPIADLLAGMYGAFGVLAALHERERTGHGQVVRTSLLASVVGVHAFQGTRQTVAGQTGRAQGNSHPSITPYGLFHCRGGSVQIAAANDSLWRKLCAAFGLDPQTPGMVTNAERVGNRQQVTALLEQTFADLSPDEVLDQLATAGVPAGRVRDLAEVYNWEQTASQGLLIDVDHDQLGGIRLPGPPLRFFSVDSSGAEREVTRTRHAAPPVLDADADALRRWVAGESVAGDD
ncbi:CaiB/BaiF CoA transferase family protein [Naumannella huperziae]